jgi:integrase
MSALRLILSEMEETGLVARNVAVGVRIERPSERENRALEVGVDVPTPDEAGTLLRHAQGRARVRLALALFTGLRASEMRRLRWADIDLAGNPLHVRQRADWWGSMGNPKSKKGRRTIPLIPLVANALKEWRLAVPPGADDNLVFLGQHGRPLSHSALMVGLDRVQRGVGIVGADGEPKYSPHKLRHFFASWMIDQGASLKELQELMGHDGSTRTLDLYGHWFRDDNTLQPRMASAAAAFVARHGS